MSESVKLAIAEDHALLREGLVSVLDKTDGIEVVFSAANGQETLDKLKEIPAEVLLMDLDMPVVGGHEVLRTLQRENVTVRPIMLTMHYSRYFVLEALSLGARGFLAKHTNAENLIDAVRYVRDVGFYVINDTTMEFMEKEMHKRGISMPAGATEDFAKRLCAGERYETLVEECNVSMDQIEQLWKDFLAHLNEFKP